ncbi:MAG: undecaprenyl-phosphate galactose phosphotransferase WbaP [Nitrospirae bacterium]|nr:undecaprenyl-phosphate galactose phosphotransferase WbaP [Nitrospirota bacterium]
MKNKRYLEIFILFSIDLISVVMLFGSSFLMRIELLPLFAVIDLPEVTQSNILSSLWIMLIWLFLFYYEGCYTKRFSFWDEVKALWTVAFFSTVGAFVIVSAGKLGSVVPRSIIVLMGVLSLPLLPLIRISSQGLLRRYGIFKRRVVIIGAGEIGRLTKQALQTEKNFGYEVIGFIDDNPITNEIDGIKVHRGIKAIHRYIRYARIADIFIALPDTEKEKTLALVKEIQFDVERIMFVPDIQSLPVIGTEIHHFFNEQIISLEIKNNLYKPYNIAIKRLFDFAASLFLLIVLSLPMLLMSLIILLDSPGSPIYTQNRVGRKSRLFRLYKFRTMFRDSENKISELIEKDNEAKEEWERFRKLQHDPRITKVGRFIRTRSLDELPQLLNVLKGEMSLVGPRPYLPEELNSTEEMAVVHHVLPGITGLWQVSGRSAVDLKGRTALDDWYVRNWSLWLDIVILLKTLRTVLKREGAY